MVDSTSRLAVSTWERYCRRWQCDVLLGRHVFGSESWREWDLPHGLGWEAVRRARAVHPRKPHWAKLVMLHALSCAYDWVLWVDADAFSTNVDLDVVSRIIPEAAAYHQSNLMAGYADSNYDYQPSAMEAARRASVDWGARLWRGQPLSRNLSPKQPGFDLAAALEEPRHAGKARNGGVLLARGGEGSTIRRMLQAAWNDVDRASGLPGEQGILQYHLRRRKFRQKVAAVSPCLLNSWPSSPSWMVRWFEGDFVAHAAAASKEDKAGRAPGLARVAESPWRPLSMPLWTYFT